MKKLFAILALVVLSSTFAFADVYNIPTATGAFTADFYCTPAVENRGGTTVDLGDFFADGQWNNVWATVGNPIYFDFTGGYAGQVVTINAAVVRTGVAADLTWDWDINGGSWQQANQDFNGTITLAGNGGVFECTATGSLSWHAHEVRSAVAGTATWTCTVTASVTI